MKKLFGLIGLLFLLCCKDQPTPPVQPGHPLGEDWFCSTLGYLPAPGDSTDAYRAVAYKNKFWPVGYEFKIGFVLGNFTQAALTNQIALVKSTCAEWASKCNLKFTFPATGPYDLRIAFDPSGGAWSYVGIDNKQITSGTTMNLGWTSRATFLHELGHAIGLLHEHQNPNSAIQWNKPNVYADLSGPPNYWSTAMIDFNVLNPHSPANVITTALDKESIMMYSIPARWTTNGFSSPGGQVISTVDASFVGTVYPFTQPPVTGNVTLRKGQVDTLLLNQKNLLVTFAETTRQLNAQNALIIKYLGRSQ